MTFNHDGDLDFNDVFCGAGGSSIGLTAAGLTLRAAANHWQVAIDTHSANFPDAEHLCADVSNYDLRRFPRAAALWASPICTELSPAGGRRRKRTKPGQEELELFGAVSSQGLVRTRATFHDVIRATEVHRYRAVCVENVLEAAEWELFEWWIDGMTRLGYKRPVRLGVLRAHRRPGQSPRRAVARPALHGLHPRRRTTA
jgi:DNA (cytosine-5)-methyltransferase 1